MYHLVSDKGLVPNTRGGVIEPSVARTEALSPLVLRFPRTESRRLCLGCPLPRRDPIGGAIKIRCCQQRCALPLAPSLSTATYYSWGGLGRAGPASSPLRFGSQVQGLGVQALSDGNDPSAGSPTETLLRLLLPLNDQVRPSFAAHLATDKSAGRGASKGLTKPFNR